MDEEMKKRIQIPAFGHWDYWDDLPISQYFDLVIPAHSYPEDGDLFKVPAPAKPTHHHHHRQKVKKRGGGGKQQQGKKARFCDVTTQQTSPRKPKRASKAVDEDLYQIPPELLNQKPKKKKVLRNLLSGCLGLSCVP